MSFSELGLSDSILDALSERGYTKPTKIQTEAIPAILAGNDVLASAQTGSGKTAGFTLPILQLLADKSVKGPSSGRPPIRALILVPTRELAAQVEESVNTYGKNLTLTSMIMIGGVSLNPQIKRLRSRVDILIATPGRLLDHIAQKNVDLSQIKILVLDEADRMLDMGFIRDIKKILALLPQTRQSLLFSATFSKEIKSLAEGFLNKPVLIETEKSNSTVPLISHKVHFVNADKKKFLLAHLIKEKNWFQVLVFTKTKHGANKLAEFLANQGISALAIHGNKSQSVRTRTLAEFKQGSLQVMVATDIAARGIDIVDLPHVVNFDLPNVPEDYVHRIGRTGRAGKTGDAVSLVSHEDRKLLNSIERLIGMKIPEELVSGFEATANSVAKDSPQKPKTPQKINKPLTTQKNKSVTKQKTIKNDSLAKPQKTNKKQEVVILLNKPVKKSRPK